MDFSKLLVRSDAEWPEAVIEHPNLKEAMLLQEDYAAKDSETTAIFTYSFQTYIIEPMDETLGHIFEEIAISEMTHHEKLGLMIVQLGGNPVIGARNGWWNGSYVNYTRNIRDMLVHNIKIEQAAIMHYRETISKLSNPSIKAVLERIILDEEIHIVTFKALLDYVTFWK
ncbi:MAG: bacterioferritin [Clostridia bacterium]|nr:bacterioferritin [Clostridia bacterium]